VGRFEAIASHLKNNVAKMPAETLLQIGNGVFCLAERGINHGIHTGNRNCKFNGLGKGYPVALTVQSLSPGIQ